MQSSDGGPNARGRRTLVILFYIAAASLVGAGLMRWIGWERASWGALSLFYIALFVFFAAYGVVGLRRRMRRSEIMMALVLALVFWAIRFVWAQTYG